MKKLLIVCDICKDEYSINSDTIQSIIVDKKSDIFKIVLDENVSQSDKHICKYCFDAIQIYRHK